MRTRAPTTAAALALLLAVAAGAQSWREPFERVAALEREGRLKDAFLGYLALPGGEGAALAIARTNPSVYLDVLGDTESSRTAGVLAPLADLVAGDLHLALGRKDEALARYREAWKAIAGDREDGGPGVLPPGYYPVEPRPDRQPGYVVPILYTGPGSHRDNWLAQRFISLEAWDDALRESRRIFAVHRRRAEALPAGLDGHGLQFAVDHAYLLAQRGPVEEALAALLEPLLLIDMERNPNLDRLERPVDWRHFFRTTSYSHDFGRIGARGLSRKEFLRIAYERFETVGRERHLVTSLRREIEGGVARLRRVLARIRLLQGRPEEATALELAYVDECGCSPMEAATRRGMVFQELGRPARAAAELEKAIALEFDPAMLFPDRDEGTGDGRSGAAEPFRAPWPSTQEDRFRIDVTYRLQQIYASLGNTAKVLEIGLGLLDLEPRLLFETPYLEELARRFESAGNTPVFHQWLRRRLAESPAPIVRANLAWVLGDDDTVIEALVESKRGEGWKQRFKDKGDEPLRRLLEALVASGEADLITRYELLHFDGRPDERDLVPLYESFIASGSPPFQPLKGPPIRSVYALAYELMKLYASEGEIDRLRALGRSIALGGAPFDTWREDREDRRRYIIGDTVTALQSCLALLIHHADAAVLEELESQWRDLAPFPARHQLERRRRGTVGAGEGRPRFGWANVPEGIEVYASNENVLALARDDGYLYAGHPWGVSVYDFDGRPITRLALGAPAAPLEVAGGYLWAGTSKGLFRIEPGSFAVAHTWLWAREPKEESSLFFPGNQPGVEYPVHSLERDGDSLWIGVRFSLQRLDLETLERRVYSPHELGREVATAVEQILAGKDYVWAEGRDDELFRYDRGTDTWDRLVAGRRELHLIGLYADALYVDILLNDALGHRLARIDRHTLEITPILIDAADPEKPRHIYYDFAYHGTWQGRHVFGLRTSPAFGEECELFALDEDLLQLEPVPCQDVERTVPEERPFTLACPRSDEILFRSGGAEHRGRAVCRLWREAAPDVLALPGGTWALGRRNPNYGSWPQRRYGESGGPFLLFRDGRVKHLSEAFANTIVGNRVYGLIEEAPAARTWLFTDDGLTLLGADGAMTGSFSVHEGLCAGHVLAGREDGGKLFFSAYRDRKRNCLSVFDPKTRVFLQHDRQGDPNSGEFLGGFPGPETPFLGGPIYTETSLGEKRALCGGRGMVVYDPGAAAAFKIRSLETELRNPAEALRLEAHRATLTVETAADLELYASSENPFIRIKALGQAAEVAKTRGPACLPIFEKLLADSEKRVRLLTVERLGQGVFEKGRVLALLEEAACEDPSPQVRTRALMALAWQGGRPDPRRFEEAFEPERGVPVLWLWLREALAQVGTPEAFALLIRYPPIRRLSSVQETLSVLGAALAEHPEAAMGLLGATGEKPIAFAIEIFRHAGRDPKLLEVVHRGLTSDDRVIRSNAARACGVIGAEASIPHLLEALDLRSGLSRASVVWALGELKAKAATEVLVEMFFGLRNDERGKKAGFQGAQATAVLRSHYDALAELAAMESEVDKLETLARKGPLDPLRDEDLLTVGHVLEALRKIGPVAMQSFYRILAGDRDGALREEAAVGLAQAAGDDREENLVIARHLLEDEFPRVRIAAAVTMLLLGDNTARSIVLEWLRSTLWKQHQALEQLERIEDPTRLAFARREIEALSSEDDASLRQQALVVLRRFTS